MVKPNLSIEDMKDIMRYAFSRTTVLIFVLPLLLLLLIGISAERMTAAFARSEGWVAHTHEVETTIERIRAELFRAENAERAYVFTKDFAALAAYSAAVQEIPEDLNHLRQLTSDNSRQLSNLHVLEIAISGELAMLQQSVDAKTAEAAAAGRQNSPQPARLLSSQSNSLLQNMIEEENRLLRQRTLVSSQTYGRVRDTYLIASIVVVLLLVASFVRLLVELRNRARAEESIRRLSTRILQLQDAERRKVARELHDGIGQYFAGLKMNIDRVVRSHGIPEPEMKILTQSLRMLDDGIAEARTLSHLLHPPLLDEVGFAAAAEWYVSGFAERSKIQVDLKMSPGISRLPKETELVLFRVLQEGLANVHRHSGAKHAEVCVTCSATEVMLEVEDHGKGISPSLLNEFRRGGANPGIGLAGMRERVSEFGGQFEIRSEGRGTLLRVRIPVPDQAHSVQSAPGPPQSQGSTQVRVEGAAGSPGRAVFLFLLQFPA